MLGGGQGVGLYFIQPLYSEKNRSGGAPEKDSLGCRSQYLQMKRPNTVFPWKVYFVCQFLHTVNCLKFLDKWAIDKLWK